MTLKCKLYNAHRITLQSNLVISPHSVRSIFLARGEVGGITGDHSVGMPVLNTRHVMHTATAHVLKIKLCSKTSGYATWFTAGGAIRIAHHDVIDDVITHSETIRDRQKRRPSRAMKSSELSNGEKRIALRQLLQNRKLRHL